MSTKSNKRSTYLEPTIANLAMVARDIEGYLEVAHELQPAQVWSDSTREHIEKFQLWVGRVESGDPVADIARTLGTGIGLRNKLGPEMMDFYRRQAGEFTTISAGVKQLVPHLWTEEMSHALEDLSNSLAAELPYDHDELVGSFQDCWELITPLRARVEEAKKEADIAAKRAETARAERSARSVLRNFAKRRIA